MAKVLLIAYACDAEDVSETWCSFQWTKRLVARHDATVLVYNRRDRRGVATRQLPGARVLEWSELPGSDRLSTFTHALKPGYLDFYGRARRAIRRLLREEHFDLVHQYEPFAPRYPSPAAGLGVPFILGPVGGAVETPAGFRREVDRDMRWFTRLRALDRFRFRHDPWLRHTYASADLVLGVAPYVRDLLAPVPLRRFDYLHETGVEILPPNLPRRAPDRGALKLLYVGRIVRTKGVRDAVRALAQLRDLPGVTLDVVGDGDDRSACEAEAAQLGLGGRVVFHGWQSREAVQQFYARADVFVFPSLREPSGSVVIEAMSHRLPLIVADNGGPGYTVGQECGIAIPPISPEQYSAAIAAAVRTLLDNPTHRLRLGYNARCRVEREFLWDRKVQHMSAIYADVIERARCVPARAEAGGAPIVEEGRHAA